MVDVIKKNKKKIAVVVAIILLVAIACVCFVVRKQERQEQQRDQAITVIGQNAQAMDETLTENTIEVAAAETSEIVVPEGYIAIYDVDGLASVPNDLAGKYILMADIDMTGKTHTIIGQTSSAPFKGTFDGNGHKISNLTIESTSDYIGMFGYVNGGTIENLALDNISIKGRDRVGGVASELNSGTITNVHVIGEVSGNRSVGGLTGYNSGNITNSYVKGQVTGTDEYTGGLVGYNSGGTGIISNCYVEGQVTGNNRYTGGLVGYLGSGTITSSYTVGTISGRSDVGGITGYNWRNNKYLIYNSNSKWIINSRRISGRK